MAQVSVHSENYVTHQEKTISVWGMRLTTSGGVAITVRVGYEDEVAFFVSEKQAENIIDGMRAALDNIYKVDKAEVDSGRDTDAEDEAYPETETSTEVDGGRDADAEAKLTKLGDIARRGGW